MPGTDPARDAAGAERPARPHRVRDMVGQWPLIAVLVLDLAIYGQHVASHKIPLCWQLHKVHHADRDIDVTTGIRFHPVEIMLSMLWKVVVVLALGAAPIDQRTDIGRRVHRSPTRSFVARVETASSSFR